MQSCGSARHHHHHLARRAAASPRSATTTTNLKSLARSRHRPRAAATGAATTTTAETTPKLVDARRRAEGAFVSYYAEIELDTLPGISLHELTPLVKQAVADSGVADGTVVVQSRHTTVAVTVNEYETRLMDDLRQYLRKLAPASDPWLHNDLHLRYAPEGWPGGDEAWRAQEPINAQAHIQAMLLGSSSTLAVVDGQVKIGQWQSVIGVELDGKRRRRWGVAVSGLAR